MQPDCKLIFDNSLLRTATWLKHNHSFFAEYAQAAIANIAQSSIAIDYIDGQLLEPSEASKTFKSLLAHMWCFS